MRKSISGAVLLAFFCLGLPDAIVPCAYGADKADKKEIVKQARESYYNLANSGLTEFRCDVLPDWDTAFSALKTDAVGRDQVLPILRKTRFELLVGPNGASTVSHHSEVAPPNEDVAERVRKGIGGTEQILTGFMETWSQFMINSTPLPDAGSDYQWEDLGAKYRITSEQGTAHAVILMTADYQIEELKVSTPEFSGTVRPKFVRSKGRFFLSSYDGTFQAGSSNTQKLSVKIEYAEIEGLNLPNKVTAAVELPTAKLEFPFVFANYQVKKK